ncbi:hypothetical protein [Natronococcus occultus]|uniref:hypothetical protein n=1 Tax=Natronococcus occultus TaxID=29288 RepID=UPI000677EA2D|nr:hypothetical protein [Natronococcus occultus]
MKVLAVSPSGFEYSRIRMSALLTDGAIVVDHRSLTERDSTAGFVSSGTTADGRSDGRIFLTSV